MIQRHVSGSANYSFISENVFRDYYKFDVEINIEKIKNFSIGKVMDNHAIIVNYVDDTAELFIYNSHKNIYELAKA